MLKVSAISVKGFKGVDSAQVPLGNVSVLAGRNSGGKSSLIQSLLVLAQSQETGIKLNGPLLMLGNSEGIVNIGNVNGRKRPGITYEFELTSHSVEPEVDTWLLADRRELDQDAYPLKIRWDLIPNAKDDTSLCVKSVKLSTAANRTIAEFTSDGMGDVTEKRIASIGDKENMLDIDVLRFRYADGKQNRKTFSTFQGLSLREIYVTTDFDNVVQSLLEVCREHEAGIGFDVEHRYSNFAIPVTFRSIVDNYAKQSDRNRKNYNQPSIDEPVTENDDGVIKKVKIQNNKNKELQEKMEELRQTSEALFKAETSHVKKKEIAAKVRDEFVRASSSELVGFPVDRVSTGIFDDSIARMLLSHRAYGAMLIFREASRAVSEFIGGIRYLGPLRAGPKPSYGVVNTTVTTPLGIDGTSTAEYLYHRLRGKNSKGTRRNLIGTIQATWLLKQKKVADSSAEFYTRIKRMVSQLEIGTDIKPEVQSKFGYTVQLLKDGVWRDLTELGTGVSQVIPVLALILDAPPNGLVLLEQPELHLHPAVQSMLAQILYERNGVTGETNVAPIICETHSEYMVTRFRLLSMKDKEMAIETDEVKSELASFPDVREKAMQFIWSEQVQDARGVVTGFSLLPLKVGPDADILSWPEGFFDTTDDDIRKIIKMKLGASGGS